MIVFSSEKQEHLRHCEWCCWCTVPLIRIYFSTPVPEVLPENLVDPEPEPEPEPELDPGQPSKQSLKPVQPALNPTQVLILVHNLY